MNKKNTPRRATSKSPPIAYGGDMVAWAAWLYYSQNRTQNNVAAELGISRASVANYLSEARAKGLVKINLDPKLLAEMQLSQATNKKFKLEGTHVIPSSDNELELRRRLGIACANILLDRISDGGVLGVAWGRTMLALAQALPERKIPTLKVVQVSGSSLGDEESSPEFCTALIANRLGAKCNNFHAPAIVSSRSMHTQLMAEPALKKHFDLIRSCGTIVFGVGNLDGSTKFADADHISSSTAKEYYNSGAVGLALGRFVGADGNDVQGELTGRMIGLSLDDLQKTPTRICVAGGVEKITILKAILKKGYATHLVTDSSTVRGLLEE